MYRILENFFRYPWRFLVILIVLPIIGIAITYFITPRNYESTAKLWALQRLIVNTRSDTSPEASETLAQSQATVMTGLLNTRSFALSVAIGTGLEALLISQDSSNSNRNKLEDEIFANISRNVIVYPQTLDLYTITYTSTSPTVAQKVVLSVINQFTTKGAEYKYANAKNLLKTYREQLNDARRAYNQDLQTEKSFLEKHPEYVQQRGDGGALNPESDPHYAALHSQRLQDELRMRNLQESVDFLNLQIGTDGEVSFKNVYRMADAPQVPRQPQPRTKQYIMGGGLALGAGVFACTIFLLILIRRDRAIYVSRDLEKLGNLPVIMGIPQLPAETMIVVVDCSA